MSYYYSPTTGLPVSVSGMPMSASGMPMSASGMPMSSDRARMYAPGAPVSLQAMQSAGSYAQQPAQPAGIAPSAYRQQVAMPAPGYPPNTIAYGPSYTAGSPYQLSTAPYPAASMGQCNPLLSGTTAAYASAYSMPAVAHANMYPYSQYRGVPMSSHTAAAVAYQQQGMPQPYAAPAQVQRPASSYSPPGAQPTAGATYPVGSYSRGMHPL